MCGEGVGSFISPDDAVFPAPGFAVSSVRVPIDPSSRTEKHDLAAVYAERVARVAGVLSTGQRLAPCVMRNRAILRMERAKLLVVHSLNANCGYEGAEAANDRLAMDAAASFGCAPEEVLTAGTGIIGVALSCEAIASALPALRDRLSSAAGEAFARAITTSDTYPKICAIRIRSGAVIAGVAKGTIMISPHLATTLVIVTTDARPPTRGLCASVGQAVQATFNHLDKDGVQSPSDMVLVMSSETGPEVPASEFRVGLTHVLSRLAEAVWRDGTSRPVLVEVLGAATTYEARTTAEAIARCELFKKTLREGSARIGRLWPLLPPGCLSVTVNGTVLLEHGFIVRPEVYCLAPEVRITVCLDRGNFSDSLMTA